METNQPNTMTLLDLLMQGGWAMYPLGLFSMVMLYLIIHCLLQTRHKTCVNTSESRNIQDLLHARHLNEANLCWERLSSHQKSAGESLWKYLIMEPLTAGKEELESLAIEGLEKWESGIGQWIQYLNVIAATAPMVGLLGTVSGMISAFQTIATGGMGKPELLAGDIGEALITTATGLVIGIPAMIAYFVLKNRLNQRGQEYTDIFRSWIESRKAGSIS